MSKFLNNYWYVAANSEELKDKPIARIILGNPIVLFRGKSGKIRALDDRCAHRLTPLSLGRIDGDQLECGYHGWTYDCAGKCVRLPGLETPQKITVKSFPLVEKWGWVFIWMGDPDKADNNTLPDFHVMGEDKWVGDGGMLRVEAHCDLIRDNLLDLTHAKYTHKQTLATEDVDRVPVTAERVGDLVRVKRVMKNIQPSPFFARAVGYTQNIIHRQTTEFTPGCNIVIRLRGNSSPGTSENLKNGLRVLNAMTPETSTSTHYFWWLGRDYNQDNTSLTQWMKDANARTFLEDKTVLEAQQQNMTREPNQRPVPSPADKGLTLAAKLTEELLQGEAELKI